MSIAENSNILISIVIPVKNGGRWIERCISNIINQSLFPLSEIIVIDSGSTDNTIEILKKYSVQVHTIQPEAFNHGLTRNKGVELSTGQYVVMTVQDAWPADKHWLQKLLDGFTDDLVAGVCGEQLVPHTEEFSPLEWHVPQTDTKVKRYHFNTAAEFQQLTPNEKRRAGSWDNVTAMYKKEALINIPFEETVYAEDVIWAVTALKSGYALVYNPTAIVYHHHFESEEYTYNRTLLGLHYRHKYFGTAYREATPSRKLLRLKRLLFSGLPPAKIIFWLKYYFNKRKQARAAHKTFTSLSLQRTDTRINGVGFGPQKNGM
ncbi:MAG: glycosyltransferase family 2 protein [Chitinophagaceae bacterium]|nr:glycosyltransferase family 2 protein [Chitinophagaceae bacterium]